MLSAHLYRNRESDLMSLNILELLPAKSICSSLKPMTERGLQCQHRSHLIWNDWDSSRVLK